MILLAARQLDVVGADVLGDAARLAGDDVGLADVVEQRGLAVVDVAHDGHDRGARLEPLLGVPTSSASLDSRRRTRTTNSTP